MIFTDCFSQCFVRVDCGLENKFGQPGGLCLSLKSTDYLYLSVFIFNDN